MNASAAQPRQRWASRLERLRKQPPFYILRAVLDHVPLRPVTVNRLHLFRFDGIPHVADERLRGPARIRAGRPEDINGLIECQGERSVFAERFASGDHCVVGVVDGRIVGYEWFSMQPQHIVPPFEYRIEIPPGSVYAYDAYIVPQYRLCGIWLGFRRYLGRLMSERSLNRILTYIEYGNEVSLRTHLRFGYVHFKTATVISLFGARMSFDSTAARLNFDALRSDAHAAHRGSSRS